MATAKSKSPPVVPGQTSIPLKRPCACGCGRSVVIPTTKGSGRPKRYFETACRMNALRRRREQEARAEFEREQIERRARGAAELDEAHRAIVAEHDLEVWCRVWQSVFGGGWQRLTAAQVLKVNAALNRANRADPFDPLGPPDPRSLVEGSSGAPRAATATPAARWTDEDEDEDDEE